MGITLLSFVVTALATVGQVAAHGEARWMHPREIASRQLEANRRHVVARNCAPEIAAYQRKRKLAKRSLLPARDATETTSGIEPHETTIKNDTCVTAPEVTEGPYYLNNDLFRQDLRESQIGISLHLDIGIIDTSTCKPLPGALVEIWNVNATGAYSGFTTSDAAMAFGNGTFPTNGTFPSGVSPSGTGSAAIPSGTGDPLAGMASPPMTDSYNFLRGGWLTNDEGIVEFITIYPGFYTGRTIHTHIMVHQNITSNSNGTYISRSGSLRHVGQMFYDEDLSNQIVASYPYNTTSMVREYNEQDGILAQENSNGYNAFVDASLIGADFSDGILGFITVGVDSTALYSVGSTNYYTGEPFEPIDSSSTADVLATASSVVTLGSSSSSLPSTVKTSSTSAHIASSSAHVSSGPPGNGHNQGQDHGHGQDNGHGPQPVPGHGH